MGTDSTTDRRLTPEESQNLPPMPRGDDWCDDCARLNLPQVWHQNIRCAVCQRSFCRNHQCAHLTERAR